MLTLKDIVTLRSAIHPAAGGVDIMRAHDLLDRLQKDLEQASIPSISNPEAWRRQAGPSAKRGAHWDIEDRIAARLVADILTAGYWVTVDDDEAIALHRSTDFAAIMAAMFSTDTDRLIIGQGGARTADARKWFLLIGGNGRDIISDYGARNEEGLAELDKIAAGAMAIAEQYE